MTEVKTADDQVVDILSPPAFGASSGMPSEMGERPIGEPISHDDVLDFHELMNDAAWFTTLAAMVEM
jgi:hypothetical protein